MTINGCGSRRGGSALELAFFLPWFVFLFVGVLDWGFYMHALISTESAARTAVLYTSSKEANVADGTTACAYVLEELRVMNNITPGLTTCNALPVIVTATKEDPGPDGLPAAKVTVTYQTQQLIPIPRLMPGRVTIYRVARMKL
jgi:Flp pilus assembly protein TadG